MHALRLVLCLCIVGAFHAHAQDDVDSSSIREFKSFLVSEKQRGHLEDASPVFVIFRLQDAGEETLFAQTLLDALSEVFEEDELRVCLPCSLPRTRFRNDGVEHTSAFPAMNEIRRLDKQMRGPGTVARTALFVQELGQQIALQAYAISDGTVVLSEVFPRKKVSKTISTERLSHRSAVQQKARGWTLSHWFNDVIVYPNPHIAIDVVDQIGKQRNHLFGVSTSLWNPLLGVGVSYHYVMPNFWNATIGGKLLMSLPTLVLSGIVPDAAAGAVIDPTFTPMVIARVPIPYTPLAVSAMASMALDFGAIRAPQVGIGLSMMDFPPALLLP